MPIFGKNAVGEFSIGMTADFKRASKFTMPERGKFRQLLAYIEGTTGGTQGVRGIIYTDSGGEPANLVVESAESVVNPNQSPSWVNLDFAWITLAPGDYWLGLHSGATTAHATYFYDTLTLGTRSGADTYVGGATATWTPDASAGREISIYADYVAMDKKGVGAAGGAGGGVAVKSGTTAKAGWAAAGGTGSGAGSTTYTKAGWAAAGGTGSGDSEYVPGGAGATYEKAGFGVMGAPSVLARTGFGVTGGSGAGARSSGTYLKSGWASVGTTGGGGRHPYRLGTAITAAQTSDANYKAIVESGSIQSLTPEYEMQWGQIQPSQGTFDWTDTDTIVAYADAHGLALRGHCLVWDAGGNTDLMPTWVTGGSWTAPTLSAALEAHITAVVNRYKDSVRVWHVVNEAFEDNGSRTNWIFQSVIGDDWIELAFQYAHAADPTATLLYNDYGIDWGFYGGNAKYTAVLAMLDDFVDRGIPVHGVGIQGHYDLQYVDYPHPADYPAALDSYRDLGLSVHVTELDCRIDNVGGTLLERLEAQAAVYALARSGLEGAGGTELTVWGLSDATNWLGPTAAAAPFDASFQAKAAWGEIGGFGTRNATPVKSGWGALAGTGGGASTSTYARAAWGAVGAVGAGSQVKIGTSLKAGWADVRTIGAGARESSGGVTYEKTGFGVLGAPSVLARAGWGAVGITGSGASELTTGGGATHTKAGWATVSGVGAGSGLKVGTYVKSGFAALGTTASGASASTFSRGGLGTLGASGFGAKEVVGQVVYIKAGPAGLVWPEPPALDSGMWGGAILKGSGAKEMAAGPSTHTKAGFGKSGGVGAGASASTYARAGWGKLGTVGAGSKATVSFIKSGGGFIGCKASGHKPGLATEVFGDDTIGGTEVTATADRKRASRFTLAGLSGEFWQMFAYIRGTTTGSQDIKGVIYADSGGEPGAKLGESLASTVVSLQAASWVNLDFLTSVRIESGQSYWLGFISGATNNHTGWRYSTPGTYRLNTDDYDDGASNPWGGGSSSASRTISIYALYAPDLVIHEKSGSGASGTTGSAHRTSTFNRGGAGTTAGVGSGERVKIGPEWYFKAGHGSTATTGAGRPTFSVNRRGAGVASGAGFGDVDATLQLSGKILVKVGSYDDVAVAGVVLLVNGVQHGDEVTAGLDSKVTNGHFETSASGWAAYGAGSPTVGRSTGEHKYGVASLQVTATEGGGCQASGSTKVWTAGKGYHCSGWVKGTASEIVSLLVVTAEAEFGTEQEVTLDGSWQYVAWDVEATASVPATITAVSHSGAQTFYLDAVMVVEHAEFIVDTTEYVNGPMTFAAVVRDADGNSAAVASRVASVANPYPAFPWLRIEVGFDSMPRDDPQVWTNVTDDFVEGAWGHGRSTVLSRMEAGQLSLVLRNHHRHYDNVNASSPYVGKVVVGKRIRVTATYNGREFPRFEGSIVKWTPEWAAGGKRAYMAIEATDDFTPMGRAMISSLPASLTTAMTGSNNDVTLTSKYGGGNDITLTLIDPGVDATEPVVETETKVEWTRTRGTTDESLKGYGYSYGSQGAPAPPPGPPATLSVSARDISITLARSGSITTTATQLVALLNADPEASKLVTAAVKVGDSGAGAVTALTKTNLSGGARQEERTGSRIQWVLNEIGQPESKRAIDAGFVTAQASEMDRQPGLDHAQLASASELGQFFFDGRGWAIFHDQERRLNATLKHTYSDDPNVAAGEHLYVTAQPDQGSQLIYNDIEVSSAGMDAQLAVDSESQLKYWPASYDHATLLRTTAEMNDRALLLLDRFKEPVEQLDDMVLEPFREAVAFQSPTAWPHALGLEVTDKLHVHRAPPGGGGLLYETFVENVRDEVVSGATLSWIVRVGMSIAYLSGSGSFNPDDPTPLVFTKSGFGTIGSEASSPPPPPPPGAPWILDDPVWSILDSTTRLG